MNSLPSTVKHPESFEQSTPPWADGIVDWGWIIDGLKSVNPLTKITPTDLDAVLERKGNFMVIETKDPDKTIPAGQKLLLQKLHALGVFTILIIWGKDVPKTFQIWYPLCASNKPPSEISNECTEEIARGIIARWLAWADTHPQKTIDSIHNWESIRSKLDSAIDEMGGTITWYSPENAPF